ncbi:MAG: EAL domain-containing protein [Pseudomonadota bacterium]
MDATQITDRQSPIAGAMFVVRHLFLLLSYTGLAFGVALSLPYSTLPITIEAAYGVGALVFLTGFALHESVARKWSDDQLRGQLTALARAGQIHESDIAELTAQISQLRLTMFEQERTQRAPVMANDDHLAEPDVNPYVLNLRDEVTTASELAGQVLRAAPLPGSLTPGRARPSEPLRADSEFSPRRAPMPQEISEAEIVALVRESVSEDRVHVVTQPIVNLPQRQVCFHEQFTRLKLPNGDALEAGRYVALAEREGFITSIDNFQLFRSAQIARDTLRRRRRQPIFVNLSSYTLRDQDFVTRFVEFLSGNAELAGRIIFEFSIHDLDQLTGPLRKPLDYLAQRGFRYSLDGVTDLSILKPRFLSARFIRFLKVPAEDFLRQADPELGTIDFDDLRDQLDSSAMDLIVSHIETRDTLLRVLDHRVDYAQGHLFGEPG